jgi:glutamate/tyrosine decarboxylase-like PLP-dependent enzyme
VVISPLEAACVLVRDRSHLLDTFSYRPPYYHLDRDHEEPGNDYYEHGMQNSRGFRALKVWLGLRHLGREGYCQLMRDNIALASQLFREAEAHEESSVHANEYHYAAVCSARPAAGDRRRSLPQRLNTARLC